VLGPTALGLKTQAQETSRTLVGAHRISRRSLVGMVFTRSWCWNCQK